MTDDELVQRARGGDAGAFDQLVCRHQAAVYRAALAALRMPEEAEEAAQDALMRAWSSIGRFRGESTFRTWVLTIAWRRAVTRRRRITWFSNRRAPLEEAAGLIEAGGTPDFDLRGRQIRTHAARAIEMLTPKLRDALLLASSGEYDYSEIGEMLKAPVGTIKWRVAEARRQVRVRLASLGYVDAR